MTTGERLEGRMGKIICLGKTVCQNGFRFLGKVIFVGKIEAGLTIDRRVRW